jgi:hypothetical protein
MAVCTKILKATPFVAIDNLSYRNLLLKMSQQVMAIEGGTHVATYFFRCHNGSWQQREVHMLPPFYHGDNRDKNFTQPKHFGRNRGEHI